MRQLALLALSLVCAFPPHAFGQSVISARSGLVNYFEGVVFLDGQPLARKSGTFGRLKDGSTLLTGAGRAEVLLTPDTYLRMGENSSIRMISDSISDTQVELLSGSSILDSAKAPAGDFVRIVFKDATIRILKPGHYRMDAEPAQLRVYEGEAEVSRDGNPVKIESSQLFPLDGAPVVKRFTQGSDGLLDLWSEERGSLIASKMVNSQTITDPLLDSGPGVPADLASYIGYMPLATISPGYSYLSPSPYGFSPYLSPYPGLAVSAFAPFPAASFLYAPRRYTPIFSARPVVRGGIGVGVAAPPRSIFVPRPVTPVMPGLRGGGTPGARPGIRPVGRR
jgi:FecR-like protein